jgi:hypothetical protein
VAKGKKYTPGIKVAGVKFGPHGEGPITYVPPGGDPPKRPSSAPKKGKVR